MLHFAFRQTEFIDAVPHTPKSRLATSQAGHRGDLSARLSPLCASLWRRREGLGVCQKGLPHHMSLKVFHIFPNCKTTEQYVIAQIATCAECHLKQLPNLRQFRDIRFRNLGSKGITIQNAPLPQFRVSSSPSDSVMRICGQDVSCNHNLRGVCQKGGTIQLLVSPRRILRRGLQILAAKQNNSWELGLALFQQR